METRRSRALDDGETHLLMVRGRVAFRPPLFLVGLHIVPQQRMWLRFQASLGPPDERVGIPFGVSTAPGMCQPHTSRSEGPVERLAYLEAVVVGPQTIPGQTKGY